MVTNDGFIHDPLMINSVTHKRKYFNKYTLCFGEKIGHYRKVTILQKICQSNGTNKKNKEPAIKKSSLQIT